MTTPSDVRSKIERVMRRLHGRSIETEEDLGRFMRELEFPLRGTYGGYSSCIEVRSGQNDGVLCDLGAGATPNFSKPEPALLEASSRRLLHVFATRPDAECVAGLRDLSQFWRAGGCAVIHSHRDSSGDALNGAAFVTVARAGGRVVVNHLPPGQSVSAAGLSVTSIRIPADTRCVGYRFADADSSVLILPHVVSPAGISWSAERFAAISGCMDVLIAQVSSQGDYDEPVRRDRNRRELDEFLLALCRLARARTLVITAHGILERDDDIQTRLAVLRMRESQTRQRSPVRVLAAYDGMTLDATAPSPEDELPAPGTVTGAVPATVSVGSPAERYSFVRGIRESLRIRLRRPARPRHTGRG